MDVCRSFILVLYFVIFNWRIVGLCLSIYNYFVYTIHNQNNFFVARSHWFFTKSAIVLIFLSVLLIGLSGIVGYYNVKSIFLRHIFNVIIQFFGTAFPSNSSFTFKWQYQLCCISHDLGAFSLINSLI